MRQNPGGPPGDPDDDGGGDGPDDSEEDTPVHSDDAARPPHKPEGDPNRDGHHSRHPRMYSSGQQDQTDLGDMVCAGGSCIVNMEFFGCPALE